jgi:hypothetical protein
MISSRNRRYRTAAAAFAAVAVSGITFTATTALGDEPREPDRAAERVAATKAAEEAPRHVGVAANVYFTDEQGNRRQPTAEEIKQAAEAFQRDLARIAGQHRGKPNQRTRADGTVSATVAVSKLAFLTVEERDGRLTYGHSPMDADGKVSLRPANDLPEE